MKDLQDRATPLFSIISVTKDDFPGIKKTVESVQAQTLRSFEHIIQECPGEDDSLGELVKTFPSIRHQCELDAGLYDAMNRGLAKACGEWVLFLNGGDTLFEAQTLEHLKALLNEVEGPWAYGGLAVQLSNQSWEVRSKEIDVPKVYWARDWFPHPSVVVRRRFVAGVGGFVTSWNISADQEWTLRLHTAHVGVRIPLTIGCLAYGGLSSTQPLWNRELEFRRIRKAHAQLLFGSRVADQFATLVLFLWRCLKLRGLGGWQTEPMRRCFSVGA